MSSDSASLLITRTRPFSQMSYGVNVKVDGKFVAKLYHDDSVTVPVSFGPHVVTANLFHWHAKPLKINVTSRGRKFIDVSLPSMFQPHRALWRPFSAITLTPDQSLVSDGDARVRTRTSRTTSANKRAGLNGWAAKVERGKQRAAKSGKTEGPSS